MPRRILVVDDYEVNRDLYREYLTFCGFEVLEARNGSETIEKALAHKPDLIVMDLGLPLLDGWSATRILKRDHRTRHVPIIVVTGFTQGRHEQAAREAGADAFLPKPCLNELVVEVGKLLR